MPNDEPIPPGADPFNADFLAQVYGNAMASLEAQAKVQKELDGHRRHCFETVDGAIRAALRFPHPSEDVQKVVALEQLQELRDALRDTL